MIVTFLREELGELYTVMADIGPEQSYLFPPYLATSDFRIDIVSVSHLQKKVIILELTACYDGAYTAAQKRKTDKYLELVMEVERKGYNMELITLEKDSRGLICIDADGF